MQQNNKLKILFVSSEVSPYAKTGGLADVSGSLPRALASMGNDVRIATPRYKMIKTAMRYVTDFPVKMDYRNETCIIREGEMKIKEYASLPVYFIDNYHYFGRDGIYGHFDDGERFAFFCNAVLEMLPRLSFKPDIIHCNDWHTGPICMMLKETYMNDSFYNSIATLYTIHNLEYQGHFPKEILRFFNVGEKVFTPDKVEFYGVFNFMKAGLVYADIINTVSEMYAKEIQTPQYGERLEGLLAKRSEDLFGIVNGICYEDFNPETDPRIYKNYSADDFSNKKENKFDLQKEFGLPERDVPVLGLVSRLSGQKGLNLIIDEIDRILSHDVQFILLGEGDEYYRNEFKSIKNRYPDKVGIYLGFNAVLAQKIYAGSDLFLMPSRFEPCGLGQIISFRYGTIPVVRQTGGLADTVIDYDNDNEHGNGFSFKEFEAVKVAETIERALKLYTEKPDIWKQLVKRALMQDFSWNKSAQRYMDIYNLAISKSVKRN